jgi:hypothetical protein
MAIPPLCVGVDPVDGVGVDGAVVAAAGVVDSTFGVSTCSFFDSFSIVDLPKIYNPTIYYPITFCYLSDRIYR